MVILYILDKLYNFCTKLSDLKNYYNEFREPQLQIITLVFSLIESTKNYKKYCQYNQY